MKNYPTLKKALVWVGLILGTFAVYFFGIRSKTPEKKKAASEIVSTPRPPDTVLTIVIGGIPAQNNYKITNMFKIYFDAEGYEAIDENTSRRTIVRDSSYWAELTDSTGKVTKWEKMPSEIIQRDLYAKLKWK